MALCRAMGLKVAQTEILKLDDKILVLSIERFDRQLDSKGRLLRLPQEDMCQALGIVPTAKYESEGGPGVSACLDLLKSSDTPDDDRRAFMKAQIVFWLIAATDGHAKNFSIFLNPQGHFSLTPLYDILSTQWQYDRSQIVRKSFRLAMAIGRNRQYNVTQISPRHFEQTAKQAGFSLSSLHDLMTEIFKQLPNAINTIQASMDKTVPEEMIEAITKAAISRAQQIEAYLSD